MKLNHDLEYWRSITPEAAARWNGSSLLANARDDILTLAKELDAAARATAELTAWCRELLRLVISPTNPQTYDQKSERRAQTIRAAELKFGLYSIHPSDGQCCLLAKEVECRCRISWECPTHGNKCIGSHD